MTRQNIIDEIARARAKSHLRERVYVLKERSVSLPSNINPVYEALDIADLQPAIQRVLSQLRAWGYDVPQSVDTRIAKKPETPDSELIEGLRSDDPQSTNLHVRRILAEMPKPEQRAYVDRIVCLLRASALWEERAIAGHMLQAAGAIDPALISVDLLDELSRHPDFAVRSSTAMILYELAMTSPGTVPVDLVGRLAQPAKEDWYVFTPALNALKQLALARAEAMERLRWLAGSAERDDREYAASALRDVAAVRPKVIPRELVEHVKRDPDRIVRNLGAELAALLDGIELHEGDRGYYRFGPF